MSETRIWRRTLCDSHAVQDTVEKYALRRTARTAPSFDREQLRHAQDRSKARSGDWAALGAFVRRRVVVSTGEAVRMMIRRVCVMYRFLVSSPRNMIQ